MSLRHKQIKIPDSCPYKVKNYKECTEKSTQIHPKGKHPLIDEYEVEAMCFCKFKLYNIIKDLYK